MTNIDSELASLLEGHSGPTTTPGAVALVSRGDHTHVARAGTMDATSSPISRDTLFPISSMTKPLTTLTALRLIDQGVLSLDQSIDGPLPEISNRRVLVSPDGPLEETVPADRAITVRDLLTFTCGFGATFDMFIAPTPWPIVDAGDGRGQLATLGPPDP